MLTQTNTIYELDTVLQKSIFLSRFISVHLPPYIHTHSLQRLQTHRELNTDKANEHSQISRLRADELNA